MVTTAVQDEIRTMHDVTQEVERKLRLKKHSNPLSRIGQSALWPFERKTTGLLHGRSAASTIKAAS